VVDAPSASWPTSIRTPLFVLLKLNTWKWNQEIGQA
jgi:hypothetical protein